MVDVVGCFVVLFLFLIRLPGFTLYLFILNRFYSGVAVFFLVLVCLLLSSLLLVFCRNAFSLFFFICINLSCCFSILNNMDIVDHSQLFLNLFAGVGTVEFLGDTSSIQLVSV